MKRLGVLALVFMILVAACQPAPAATPTNLPTAVVTDLPTGNEGAATQETGGTGAEATEAAGTTTEEAGIIGSEATEETGLTTAEATTEVGLAPTTAMTEEATSEAGAGTTVETTSEAGAAPTAEVTGEPASSTAVSAVTGASTAEATADMAAMMPGNYCVEVTGLEGEPVVMQLNQGTYTYTFEGAAGAESTTGAAPNVVPTGMHTLTFQDSEGRYQFVLTLSGQVAPGTYQLGTAQMANQAGGPAPAETTAEAGTGSSNANTGQNSPNTNTGAGGAGTGNAGAGAEATSEVGTALGMGASLVDQHVTLTAGTCADMMREAGMEVTAEPGTTGEATAEAGAMAAEATEDMGILGTATPSGSADSVQSGSAVATATDASATVVASGSDTQPGGEATADAGSGGLNTTPASPAEPSSNNNLTIIGARLEPMGGAEGTSYIVLESGMLEITRMEQQESFNILSGAFTLTLTSSEDTTSSVTVQGFFQNLPVNQTPQ